LHESILTKWDNEIANRAINLAALWIHFAAIFNEKLFKEC
jgi:hypothetical protein